jgi:hypothetical protein
MGWRAIGYRRQIIHVRSAPGAAIGRCTEMAICREKLLIG